MEKVDNAEKEEEITRVRREGEGAETKVEEKAGNI
jgi:hypothetical protein